MTNLRPRFSPRLVCAAAALLASSLTFAVGVARAQSIELAGSAAVRELEARVTLAWHGQSLGAALDRLVETQQTPLWIDRRVDTSAVVDLQASNEPVRSVLNRLAAQQRHLAAVPFRSVVYFGPRQTAEELATLSILAHESLSKAPAAVRAKWLQATAWSFPRLSQPRALVDGLARSVGASVSDEQRVPLDLWTARSLPPLAVVDRVVLVLAGFDLTAEISPDGKRLRVTPTARPIEITRQYAVPRARQAAFDAAVAELPSDKVRQLGSKTEVAARWEDHERLRTAIRGASADEPPVRKAAKGRGGAQRSPKFTLKISNQPVDRVIEQIAGQTGLTVEWTSPPPQSPKGLVSCDVREVELDELLGAILAPIGLSAEREKDKVTIRNAP